MVWPHRKQISNPIARDTLARQRVGGLERANHRHRESHGVGRANQRRCGSAFLPNRSRAMRRLAQITFLAAAMCLAHAQPSPTLTHRVESNGDLNLTWPV